MGLMTSWARIDGLLARCAGGEISRLRFCRRRPMKTAVSIPDDVFKDAESLAWRTKKSRSQLFSDAVREYVARHAPEAVTDAMNQVSAHIGKRKDEFVSAAARRVLERSEW